MSQSQGTAMMTDAGKVEKDSLDMHEVFVGKDVLDLLSSSMYANPLMIFREYVQNATDAIDEAVNAGLLESIAGGRIEIDINHEDRHVVIRDNGIGLSNAEFSTRMLSFGASVKRGTSARGFRGVGRLSALGQVRKLVFRGRSKGDAKIMEAVWDGQILKKMLNSSETGNDLVSIVRKTVTVRQLDPEGEPEHFFEVELVKPRRIANDRLLNECEISAFIGQTCPCPFSLDFAYGDEITDMLAPHGRAEWGYNIHVNKAKEPVYRPYFNEVIYSNMRKASLHDMKPFKIKGVDGGLAAIGWLVHHDYQGAIPATQGMRGLRARVGNIQVGDDRLFHEVFPEERFCSWTIGEVHILDERIVPNGRRDGFENNMHLDNLIAHLRPIGAEVARACRFSSQKRNQRKIFDRAEERLCEKLDILKQGAISSGYAGVIRREIDALLAEMRKVIESDLFEGQERRELKDRMHESEGMLDPAMALEKAGSPADVLKGLPENRQVIYREIFDLIHECSLNQGVAKDLVDRMLVRLS